VRGFSLVESIVAVGLLAVTLILLAHVVAVAVSTNAFARQATLAAIFAGDKLEQLRLSRDIDVSPVVSEFLDNQGETVCGGTACESAVYVRRWSVAPFGGVPDAYLLQVVVRHRSSASREARAMTVRAPRVRE
jgi:Tfp pilus assembly protein PilV